MSISSMLHSLPEDLASRKVLLIVLTMMAVLIIALIGTIIVTLMGADNSLLFQAMQLITGAGGVGAISQAVPDSIQAGKGTYRASQTVTNPVIATYIPTAVPLSMQSSGPKSMFGS